MSQARFQKQQREKARREKAAAKSARRAERAERSAAEGDDGGPPPMSESQVLDELAELHRRFENETLSFEEFEESKQQLMERLRVE